MRPSLSEPCLELLERQHGVLARWQGPLCGLSPPVLAGYLRYGYWRPLYRGVYLSFTGEPPRMAQLWGALLRAGPDAALSHHTAAELDQLTDKPAGTVHVTVSSTRRVANPGAGRSSHAPAISLHYSARLPRARHPLRMPPRTRIEETVLDLAEVSRDMDDALTWLIHACARRLTTAGLLRETMSYRAKLRWRHELASTLSLARQGAHSPLEVRYVRHVESPHGLPPATRQAPSRAGLRIRYLDNHYTEFGVAVELDGQAAHPAGARWQDIRRDNASAALGIITLRYGWADITADPCRVAAEIAKVLNSRGWRGLLRRCGAACTAVPS